ncbi:HigA family addiction module antitoxin [Providencia huaxiensis]|uniref:HigA family addiction module antitoxin n=1 Tax=Providencia TaxID=586 RepID=UPI001B376742|nr:MULTISPECIES: HigA family addiction module antitoxin [Providencia]MBQ0535566.1 HigA family addiction module antidote protein [Providencia huaxiensis]MBQ0590187.1 HigA family addiction module antidote protein [Providencia huaxiensis]
MSKMHNPVHPGIVLREYLEGISVTEAAKALEVTRTTLSRILNGNSGISADMAIRLEMALGTSAEMWVEMQAQYELWQASLEKRPTIKPLFPRREGFKSFMD